MNPSVARDIEGILNKPSPRNELTCASPVRVAASLLSRAPGREMTATTVVGVLDGEDVEAFRALVNDIADEYGLDATLTITPGSFSVRFQR
ncbi:MAG TPA: hypothetical protein VF937_13870 [Chloroflexota bacterium]